jgi:plastocyanin
MNSRTWLWIIIGVIVIVAAILIFGSYRKPTTNQNQNPTNQAPNTVNIQNYSFNPPNLTVKKGTTVTWTNNDSTTHTVTSDSGNVLNSTEIAPGGTFQFTFNDTGNFPYHCTIHTYEKGNIVVQ